LVLRQQELKSWQQLMAAIEPLSTSVDEEQVARVREHAAALLAVMQS
jgi:hypothetical protein